MNRQFDPDNAPTPVDFVPDRYMPVRRADLVAALANDHRLTEHSTQFRALAKHLSKLYHHEYFDNREEMKDLYVALNPDQPGDGALEAPDGDAEKLYSELRSACLAANFTELSREQILAAEKQMGRVRAIVRVPWDLYQDIFFFVRGKRTDTIEWREWFGLRKRSAEVVEYDKVVLFARLKKDPPPKSMRRVPLRPGGLYLKVFRDIPKADMNTLFPNGKILMSRLDQALIAVPAIVGGIPILINIIPALSVLFIVVAAYLGFHGTVEEDQTKKALAAVSGLGALGAFFMRQWVKYERQALLYQKRVSDNAHFKNLNNNAAFFDFIIGQSEESEVKEAILAYAFLWMAEAPLTANELDRRIEAWLTEQFDMVVDFDVEDGLGKALSTGIAVQDRDTFSAVPLDDALIKVRKAWRDLAETD